MLWSEGRLDRVSGMLGGITGLPLHAARLLLCCCLASAHVLPLAGVAGAASIEEARAAYAEGRFARAARTAARLGTSRGYALAAKSLAVYGYFIAGRGKQKALLERAVGLAQKAVRADSRNADAHLQLARATGRLAQTMGSLEAASRGYAEKIREASENAVRLDPGMASAHVSLGRWHAGVVGAVGPFLARLTYGASKEDAIASLRRAFELAPDAKDVPRQYALGLLELDEDEYRDRARALLKRSIALPAKDAFERLVHKLAVRRLRALDASGR